MLRASVARRRETTIKAAAETKAVHASGLDALQIPTNSSSAGRVSVGGSAPVVISNSERLPGSATAHTSTNSLL